MEMNQTIEKIRRSAERVLKCKIKVIPRAEWESKIRSGGEPTLLSGSLSPFSNVGRDADVVAYAASARPWAQQGGFHVVRRDDRDAPNEFNRDSYLELQLTTMPEWPRILSIAGAQVTAELEQLLSERVFLRGPEKWPDHHSPRIPLDIDGASTK